MSDIEKAPVSLVATSNDPDTKGEVIDVDRKVILDRIHDDLGRGLFEQSLQHDTAQMELDDINVRKKLDFIVLPMVSYTSVIPQFER